MKRSTSNLHLHSLYNFQYSIDLVSLPYIYVLFSVIHSADMDPAVDDGF